MRSCNVILFCPYRRNYLNHGSVSAVRNFSTPADEKTAVPELSENEKKLVAEIESLNKDVENYKEKCVDLDVCQMYF